MLEGIDPKLLRADPLPISGGGGRQTRRAPDRGAPSPRYFAEPDEVEQIDETLARLVAVIADVERLAHEEAKQVGTAPPPNVADVAARIAQDRLGALKAQAKLGPAGVRLVLDGRRRASDAEPE